MPTFDEIRAATPGTRWLDPTALAELVEAMRRGLVAPIYSIDRETWTPSLTTYTDHDPEDIYVGFERIDESLTTFTAARRKHVFIDPATGVRVTFSVRSDEAAAHLNRVFPRPETEIAPTPPRGDGDERNGLGATHAAPVSDGVQERER
jgi:hypothetical protein